MNLGSPCDVHYGSITATCPLVQVTRENRACGMGMELLFSVDTVPIHTAKERGENCACALPLRLRGSLLRL